MNSRRKFLASGVACLHLGSALTTTALAADDNASKPIALHPDHLETLPGSKQQIPSIGMGTWITFDVPDNAAIRNQRVKVLDRFFEYGGGMIDSSPMYGSAESVLGYCLDRTASSKRNLFAASKIWTPASFEGVAQMNNTEKLWGINQMDLMYVHNMLNWKSHLPRLREWKSEGRISYLGITTSHGRRHDLLAQLIKSETLDFVQLTYNYDQRGTEDRLIPLAQDHGVAVIVNRPFQRGHLIDKYQSKPLPGLAGELGCKSWAQYLLLFAVSHPGVTAAIPATSREDHMVENMSVMQLPTVDQTTRKLM